MNYLTQSDNKNLKLSENFESFSYLDSKSFETNLVYENVYPALVLEADFKIPDLETLFVIILSEDCSEIKYIIKTSDEKTNNYFGHNKNFRTDTNFPKALFNAVFTDTSKSYTEPIVILDRDYLIRVVGKGKLVVSEYNKDERIYDRLRVNEIPYVNDFESKMINTLTEYQFSDFYRISEIMNLYRECLLGESNL
jgi:hypothetical protein